jgi:hypothetical protein
MSETNQIFDSEGLQRFYGEFYAKSARLQLSAKTIPRPLWPLIPYAEFWGVSDDFERDILVDEAPIEVQQNLKATVMKFDGAMDEWLAGPEARISPPSPEYIAFTDMRMAADYAKTGEPHPFLSRSQMPRLYGNFYNKNPRVGLNQKAIPMQFWPLMHYAEFWGVTDDRVREKLVAQAPPEVRQNLKTLVARFVGDFDAWRDGLEPDHPPNTPEYEAFAAMRKAAESA